MFVLRLSDTATTEFPQTDGTGLMMRTCAPFHLYPCGLPKTLAFVAWLAVVGCESTQSTRESTQPSPTSSPRDIPPQPVAASSNGPQGTTKNSTIATKPPLMSSASDMFEAERRSITPIEFLQPEFNQAAGQNDFVLISTSAKNNSEQQLNTANVGLKNSPIRQPPVRLPEVLDAMRLEQSPTRQTDRAKQTGEAFEIGVWTNLTTGRPDSDNEVPVFDVPSSALPSSDPARAPKPVVVAEPSRSNPTRPIRSDDGVPPFSAVADAGSIWSAAGSSSNSFDARMPEQLEWFSNNQRDEASIENPKVQVRRITQTVAQIPPPSAIQLAAAIQDSHVIAANLAEEPRITLHVDDVEVRKVFEMLSRDGSGSILVSPKVIGKVTANLEKVTQQDALDAIVKMANLVAHREGNITFIYTTDEYQLITQSQDQIGTRVYTLNYMRAQDLSEILTQFLSKEAGRISVTPESDVGIESDTDRAGGNSMAGGESLVVQDYETVLKMIDNIIPQLDVQPVQVVIEAVIIEAILDENLSLGVNFGVLDGAQNSLLLSGSGAAINSAAGFIPASVLTAAGGVSQGFAGNEGGVKFGFVDDDVTGFIQALERVTEARVLASPRVLVLNKQRAELIIGERIGFKTVTVTQTSTVEKVEFLNVGTQLRLRPFVTSDRMIRLEIHPERSTGDVIDGVPRTRTNEITTNVMVPDGATIVLAGLIEEEDITSQDGVPGLSRIPYLGALFRRRSNSVIKKELIVLITPRIWTPFANEVMPVEPHGPRLIPDAATSYESPKRATTRPALNINAKKNRPSKLQFIR